MESITIGFSRPQGGFQPFSWLIRLAYWSPFSHAYLRYEIPEVGTVIFQASGLKVNLIGQTLFDSKEDIYAEFSLPISAEEKAKLIKFTVSQLGQPYNVVGIFGMAWVRLGQLLGQKWHSPFNYTGSSAFCSEIIAQILESYENISLGDVADDSPQAVYQILVMNKLSSSVPSQKSGSDT